MAMNFFFYDLETSGLSSREARIMQFAGQRTNMDLQPIGDPVNVLIKLSPDVLPDPRAVLLTGITPQQALSDGLSEAEFLRFFYKQVVRSDTIFLGYNTIRFDDEFMRFLHYRNFYDAYEWQWKMGCSRWDLLDVVRMTRALRPDGIAWPVSEEGKPTNRLELLTKLNGLAHEKAHDALDDVRATIAVARLLRDKQPKLFDYLLSIYKKDQVKAIVERGDPFMYTSSHYAGSFLHTSPVVLVTQHPTQASAVVYDLRVDPTPFLAMSVDQLAEHWHFTRDPETLRLPLKSLKYNHCPAIAPGVVQDAASLDRLDLKLATITKHLSILAKHQVEFAEKIRGALAQLDTEREQTQQAVDPTKQDVDMRLYDGGFFSKRDKDLMAVVRAAEPTELSELAEKFDDTRLTQLLPRYKARNYPSSLTSEERAAWDAIVQTKLLDGGAQSRLAGYFEEISTLAAAHTDDSNQSYLLEELRLYGESIVPGDVGE